MFPKIERTLLIVFEAFLGITAVLGGIGLLSGLVAPGPEMLQGTPFKSYIIPGLTLLLIVGGSALLAMYLMWRLPQLGILASLFTGVMIICFETVEVLAFGSPAGSARNMQIFYFTLGTLILLPSIHLWINRAAPEQANVQPTMPKAAVS